MAASSNWVTRSAPSRLLLSAPRRPFDRFAMTMRLLSIASATSSVLVAWPSMFLIAGEASKVPILFCTGLTTSVANCEL